VPPQTERNPLEGGDIMAQIFISHSRHDLKLRQWFDEVFAGVAVRAVRFEFEFDAQAKNPIPSIVQMVQQSTALFVLLGANIFSATRHTSNWIAAETGVAKAFNIPIWVFEDIRNPTDFPVPFVDHYVRLRLDIPEYHNAVRGWVSCYQPIIRSRDPIPDSGLLLCSNPGCRSAFQIHQPKDEIDRCPVCVTKQAW